MAIHTGRRFLHAAFSVTGVAGLTCGAQRLTSCEASQQDAWFVSIGRSLVLAKPWFGSLNVGLEPHLHREPEDGASRIMLVVPHNRPPWASIMERHIEIAIPTPAGFVTKYSKIRSRSSAATPGPYSPTGTNKASSGLDSVPTTVRERRCRC